MFQQINLKTQINLYATRFKNDYSLYVCVCLCAYIVRAMLWFGALICDSLRQFMYIKQYNINKIEIDMLECCYQFGLSLYSQINSLRCVVQMLLFYLFAPINLDMELQRFKFGEIHLFAPIIQSYTNSIMWIRCWIYIKYLFCLLHSQCLIYCFNA